MTTVFIDGQHGTTGLQIYERLSVRNDIELISIDEDRKKDAAYRSQAINESDITILCLPDAAAKEAAAMVKNPKVRIIDGSSAHRVADGWEYGIPELNKRQRERLRQANRISVPGCYPTGFNLCVHPLVANGILPANYPVSCYAVTGCSGGGRPMINDFEQNGRNNELFGCMPKNLQLNHKHLPEMKKYGLLEKEPCFHPIVGNFYKGMIVSIPIHHALLTKSMSQTGLISFFEDYYEGEAFIRIAPIEEVKAVGDGFFSPLECNDTNRVDIFVFSNKEQTLLAARLDNLGKGASGAAVQNLNLLIGANEQQGLIR